MKWYSHRATDFTVIFIKSEKYSISIQRNLVQQSFLNQEQDSFFRNASSSQVINNLPEELLYPGW